MRASLDVDHGSNQIGFAWTGFLEMTEVSGSGPVKLRYDGSLQIEFEYHLCDEAVIKAVREPSPKARS